ncbi:putative nucleotidyltransferase substrate binding domain-containing protein [Chitinilyticum litopenaei]|uniref:putative nucleotidyltransferase substrate binding domain-containing protein n=1 Tax=Chitinilyticum litopenaei TaxID=1121276 RepID=UPI000408D05D|nr:putative nucleotidyltransferase substrate binding domain-containing protein [Chitinilyticum litopenaei]
MSSNFDFSHSPFDTLTPAERAHVADALDILYYPAHSDILAPGDEVTQLYVVMKGLVEERGEHGTVFYAANDVFDSRALVSGTAGIALQATEDTLLWQIPREVILAITRSNAVFAAFFYDDVARRLATLAHKPYRQEQAALMLLRVSQCPYRPPCWLDHNATVITAARTMQQEHVTAVLVRGARGTGIFTQSDLRNFVIDGLDPHTEPVEWHANYGLIGIEDDDFLHQAMLLMVRHTIQRLLVTRQGEICGILEQVDLLSCLANNPHTVTGSLERATSLVELRAAATSMAQLVVQLHGNGMKVTLIAELVSELRQKLLSRLFTLLAPPGMLEQVCLLVLGSEGRGEQILRTDQDNALIVADGYDHPQLAEVCERFTAELLAMGYPPCPGGVMLNTPQWRRSVSDFRRQINAWTGEASGEQLLQLAIWIDARPVCGNATLHAGLDAHLRRWLADNDAFLARFAWPIEQFEPPLSLFARLVTAAGEHGELLDLKKGGIFPIVHGIRSLALQYKVVQSNTYQRIEKLRGLPVLPDALASDVAEALAYLQGLQLRHGIRLEAAGQRADNLIDPRTLSTLERDLLKDALGVVKRLRLALRHHFRLGAL